MKLNKIIILALVFSMLLINVTSVFASEMETDNLKIIDASIENTSENDISTNSIGDVDTSQIMAQSKGHTGEYKNDDDDDDDENVIFQTDNFASYYFNYLDENFGNNTHGSCGYVATAMMLSYYDTYLNDNIIDDDNYDVPTIIRSLNLASQHLSPGVRREKNSLLGGTPNNDSMIKALDSYGYWNLITNNYRNSFHLNLIKLAEDQFDMYHDVFITLEENNIIDQTGYPCASTMWMQRDLIQYYLNQIEVSFSLQYELFDIRNFTISKVKEGQPVMLLLGSDAGFHFVVACDLDDKNTEDTSDDDIYAHYGWEDDKVHININTDTYPWLISALAINFDLEHSCSNNYHYHNMYGYVDSKCSCYFPCHDEHEHTYIIADETHTYTCGCVATNSGAIPHSFTYTNLSSYEHQKQCVDCGHTAIEDHSLEYRNLGEFDHGERCTLCDYDGVAKHDYQCDGMTNSVHTERCEKCNHTHEGLTNGEFVRINSSSHSATCTTCGYAISNAPHNWVYSSLNAQYHTGTCADCGTVKSLREAHSWTLADNPNYVKCSFCGHLKIKTGNDIIPVLPTKEKDPEEEVQ